MLFGWSTISDGDGNKLKAVIDTNVLISAWLRPDSLPNKVIRAGHKGAFQLQTSQPILDELERILVKKFKLDPALAHRQELRITKRAEIVSVHSDIVLIPHGHNDNLILATAIDGNADYLVTGDDKHLLPIHRIGECQIVTPRQFLQILKRDA